MKTRQGFVSNSSSSSYIIALPNIPYNSLEVKRMFFPNRDYWPMGDGTYAKTSELSIHLYHALRLLSQVHPDDESNYIWRTIYQMYEWKQARRGMYTDDDDFPHSRMRTYAKLKHSQFMEDIVGSYLFVATFSDDSGPIEALLEHDERIYERFPYLVDIQH